MFIVYVHHECMPDRLEAAARRIDSNGEGMSRIPGFLFRYRTHPMGNILKISTVTGWVDEAAYDAWLKVKAGIDYGPDPAPFVHVVNERHVLDIAHMPSKDLQ